MRMKELSVSVQRMKMKKKKRNEHELIQEDHSSIMEVLLSLTLSCSLPPFHLLVDVKMRLVLEEVISESQSAFLEGKFILDGPLIVNEVLSWLKKKKSKAFILKIDFEKAYDNVNWNFVISILNQMGFPTRWCHTPTAYNMQPRRKRRGVLGQN
ncbi:putative reverse transcriptase domain-containing protein [Helianthus annuus]|nr:putative reverse transcriptase domain-containing protein [Helianthus annuus]